MRKTRLGLAIVGLLAIAAVVATALLEFKRSGGSHQIVPPPPLVRLPVATTQPNRQMSATDVVHAVMDALHENDEPAPDTGIATTFAFASASNKKVTGPLQRFIALVHNPAYAPMIDWEQIDYGRLQTNGDHAQFPVRIVTANGEVAVYVFELSRQSDGDFDGCWMTDGVMRVAPPDNAATQPAPPSMKPDGRQEADVGQAIPRA